jgi:hypothetical protein
MAKRPLQPKIKTPIKTPDEERFMAFEGLVQWTQAVIAQGRRVSEARDRLHNTLHQIEDHRQRRHCTAFSPSAISSPSQPTNC